MILPPRREDPATLNNIARRLRSHGILLDEAVDLARATDAPEFVELLGAYEVPPRVAEVAHAWLCVT